MATLILNHKVKDYATWKAGFDSDEQRRNEAGISLLAVGEKAGEPGNVYAVFTVADPSVLEGFLADPQLQAKMQELGVISAPERVLFN